jgi:pectinesterase
VAWLFLPLLLCSAAAGAVDYTLDNTYKKLSPRHPDIVPVRLQPTDGVRHWPALTYREMDGRQLQMDVFAPENVAAPRPGLLLVHGGGWRTGSRSLLAPLAQALAARGYVTATASYRLSQEAVFSAAVEDLLAALAWLRANADDFNLDPARLAIGGSSAGGQLAALAGLWAGDPAHDPDGATVAAIVNIDGLWDFTTPLALQFENDPARPVTSASAFLGGRFEEIPDTWRRASPINYLNADSPPLLALSGENPRFSAGIGLVETQARILDVPFRRHHYEAAPHSFWLFQPWFDRVVAQLDEFLSANLVTQDSNIEKRRPSVDPPGYKSSCYSLTNTIKLPYQCGFPSRASVYPSSITIKSGDIERSQP